MSAQQSLRDVPAFHEPAVTADLAKTLGLKPDEYQVILDRLGRTPTYTELSVFSVMWSEHCSYKSSRHHLKNLPTTGPYVLQGPGENAGVIDIGDGDALVFKMESHNHPSFLEPYNGAATGVGGILRDVFTMGARPIASLNALRFGAIDHPKTKGLLKGVVSGIAGYGNAFGVPTVAGEVNFHDSYNGNILVNAMAIGLARADKIFLSTGGKPDMPVVYVGSKTGRDGIHGATMASAEFSEDDADQRPTVQVGDPFTEKLLLEACLELMQSDAIVSIQDMGAAGLTSSGVEIASKGNIGVTLWLDRVPMREERMLPFEIMLSESQERMLMILKPGSEAKAEAIFKKWDLDFAVIGTTTDTGHLRLEMYGRTWCDIPVAPLVDDAPKYIRPTALAPAPAALPDSATKLPEGGVAAALKTLIACPDACSKRWVWEQYDSLVRGETKAGPGLKAAAAIVRIPGHQKAMVTTSDCTPRYCQANAKMGAMQAVAESWRNITATGATPMALTNNLNYGNPEKPVIMGQIADGVAGIATAATALSYPVISGNVSLYNETNGQAIQPTPVIGGVGMIADITKTVGMAPTRAGQTLVHIGIAKGHLGQSLFAREIHGAELGDAPNVDLAAEKANGDFVRAAILDGTIKACQDVSDGGALCAIAEMCMAANMGADLRACEHGGSAAFWFGEDQARYIVAVDDADAFLKRADAAGIAAFVLGATGGDGIVLQDTAPIAVADLTALHECTLPNLMR